MTSFFWTYPQHHVSDGAFEAAETDVWQDQSLCYDCYDSKLFVSKATH